MNNTSKPIQLSSHARMQFSYRGATEEEVIETIRNSKWKPTELNRLESQKEFIFNQTWNNKYYKIKCVRPIFIEEKDEIVVVTVYVYYF